MSKRCHNSKRSSSRSPSSSKRHSRCNRQASQGRSSSSSSRSHGKCKNTRKTKKSYCDSGKSSSTGIRSIEKKERIEHLTYSEAAESGTSEAKKRGRKHNKREAKRRRKKKKRTADRKKLSGSSACSRLIDLLLKSCTCLERLDSSSTFPNGDNPCCCKCRFCRPYCESKSVQCDDCEHFFAQSGVCLSNELRGSGREANEDAAGRSWECLEHDESVAEEEKNYFRRREFEDSLNIRSQKRQNKSDIGICRSIVRSFSSFKNFGKRRISTKSLIDDRAILEDDTPKCIPPPRKILKPVESEEKNYRVVRRCRTDDRSKSTKALLIMFDIVFWPYTCLPGRRSDR